MRQPTNPDGKQLASNPGSPQQPSKAGYPQQQSKAGSPQQPSKTGYPQQQSKAGSPQQPYQVIAPNQLSRAELPNQPTKNLQPQVVASQQQPYISGSRQQPYNGSLPQQPFKTASPQQQQQPFKTASPQQQQQPFKTGSPQQQQQPFNTASPQQQQQPFKTGSPQLPSPVSLPQGPSSVAPIKQPSRVASLQQPPQSVPINQLPSSSSIAPKKSPQTSGQQGSKARSNDKPSGSSDQQGLIVSDSSDYDLSDSKTVTCFFNDGIRRIDYVLVWEEPIEPIDDYFSKQAANYRKKFEDNLVQHGVEIERETSVSSKKRIHFLKLFISWTTMCYYAEYLGFRTPLEEMEQPEAVGRRSKFFSQRFNNEQTDDMLRMKLLSKQKQYYTCAFSAEKQQRYVGITNQDSYFRPTQRFEVAFELLGTLEYGRKDLSEVGLDSMIRRGIYSCAFPPHEGPANVPKGLSPENMNSRQLLHNYWARWKLWFRSQPLDHVRDYFGEKIAFYFAFTGYYTAWLVPASLIGIATFGYGVGTIGESVVVKEVCEANNTFKMCPMCDNIKACKYWYLRDICGYIRAAHVFDHAGTHIYSFAVSLWAYGFLEFWKRRTARLAYQWDVIDYVEVQERPRPEYTSMCTDYAVDPVTGNFEPHFPNSRRRPRLAIGLLSLVLMMVLTTGSLVIMLLTRASIILALFENELVRSRALTIGNASSACINLILVLALELIYEKIAFNITEWEMHRTQTQFENAVILKVFIFEMFNHYLSISYIAFIKDNIAGRPGSYTMLFGTRLAECINGSCMFELTQIMAIILVGKQVAVQVIELLIPKLQTMLHIGSTGLQVQSSQSQTYQKMDADYMLIPYDTGLFMDYLEIVMQFGFVTLFVPAFPLAPLFALMNNIVEIRLDARKLVLATRRPLPERAQGIGIWYSMLKLVAHLATITNGSLMAFTSESLVIAVYGSNHGNYKNITLSWAAANVTTEPCRYNKIPDYTQEYWKLQAIRLIYMLSFQQIVFGLTSIINCLIPDIPEDLRKKIQRQKYLAKQALIDRAALGRRGKRVHF